MGPLAPKQLLLIPLITVCLQLCVCVYVCVCVYLDEVVGAEAEELQQLKVAAGRKDVLDHRWLQQDLSRGDNRGLWIFL